MDDIPSVTQVVNNISILFSIVFNSVLVSPVLTLFNLRIEYIYINKGLFIRAETSFKIINHPICYFD